MSKQYKIKGPDVRPGVFVLFIVLNKYCVSKINEFHDVVVNLGVKAHIHCSIVLENLSLELRYADIYPHKCLTGV